MSAHLYGKEMPKPIAAPGQVANPRVTKIDFNDKGRDPNRNLAFAAGLRGAYTPVGAGSSDAVGAICKQINADFNTPAQFLPVIHQVQATFDGPIPTALALKLFAPDAKPFLWNENTLGPSEISTTLWDGQPIAPFLCYHIGVHCETSPQAWTSGANVVNIAFENLHGTIPSPNDYTLLDKKNGSFLDGNGAPLDVSNNLFPAVVRYGGSWQSEMFYHLVRAVHYQWKTGNLNSIIDNMLRTIAYTPTTAQNGSSSSSEVDVDTAFAEMNAYYQQPGYASALAFRKFDRTRLGCVTTVAGITGSTSPIGNFPVSRQDLVPVTYGAGAVASALVRDLKNNSEYVRLDCPYLIDAGVPPGVLLRVVDQDQYNQFIKRLSINETSTNQQAALIPPYVTDDASVPLGYDNGCAEQALDATTVFRQQRDTETYIGKTGPFKLSFYLLGRELGDNEVTCLKENRDAIAKATGCSYPFYRSGTMV